MEMSSSSEIIDNHTPCITIRETMTHCHKTAQPWVQTDTPLSLFFKVWDLNETVKGSIKLFNLRERNAIVNVQWFVSVWVFKSLFPGFTTAGAFHFSSGILDGHSSWSCWEVHMNGILQIHVLTAYCSLYVIYNRLWAVAWRLKQKLKSNPKQRWHRNSRLAVIKI